MTAPRLNPRALRVPIWVRSSSTIRVMVVRQTSAATRTKKTGKTAAIASTLSASSEMVLTPGKLDRSRTYHSGCSRSESSCRASAIWASASAMSASASAFSVSYSERPSSYSASPSFNSWRASWSSASVSARASESSCRADWSSAWLLSSVRRPSFNCASASASCCRPASYSASPDSRADWSCWRLSVPCWYWASFSAIVVSAFAMTPDSLSL